ncbi:Phenolphthiocerol synthesis polyketide synthase type I Pks15/1 [Aquisphaera giovannonii]|uniref:Phenolphthiocerol synthesis polyketide synthase type I Pks15/1 n=1 Tax=Aquisphaera giovannonii TaxID=406548 RepID=A0A5B9W659_9BACT|nr:NADP-dependent oxidoreductase [Aquisphaera giovannonii]QEH35460.1 Phenolphthiocerol synthesis polyketide synthase type I Pks15/1 [Aquisphaera giovannonii]
MKAIRLHARGGPEQIVYEDAPRPAPAAGEALLRVHAAGITPTELTWTETYRTPDGRERLPTIPGHDVSGVVETLGPGVSDLSPGEAVYGLIAFPRDGSAAEYVAVKAADLAPKPRALDHAHAAAVPLSALTAWQALFDHAGLGAGQRILIHGAAGGVGAFAVQLARRRGAQVAATASARHHDFLRELGAEAAIDYRTTRFEEVLRDVDVVLDTVGGDTLERSWRVLRRGGTLVSVAAPVPPEAARDAGARGVFFIVEPSRAQLVEIARLIDAGEVRPVLEAVLPLARAREAFERGLAGHVRGKIVLQVQEPEARP